MIQLTFCDCGATVFQDSRKIYQLLEHNSIVNIIEQRQTQILKIVVNLTPREMDMFNEHPIKLNRHCNVNSLKTEGPIFQDPLRS